MDRHAEVVVVGGGPAGCATAFAAAELGLPTALVDRPGRVPRWETLNRQGVRTLEALLGEGLAGAVKGVRPLHGRISVWGQNVEEVPAIRDLQGPVCAVERTALDESLVGAVQDAGIRVLSGDATVGRNGITVRTRERTHTLQAQAIDATGRPAVVARAARRRHLAIDRLVCLTSSGQSAADEDTFMVESMPGGWAFSVPAADGCRAVTVACDARVSGPLRDPVEWMSALSQHAPHVASTLAVAPPGRPVVASARSARLPSPIGDDWLAVGDAAMAFDPLSSQGMMTALDAAPLAAAACADRSRTEAYVAWCDATWDDYLEGRRRTYAASREADHAGKRP